MPREYPEYPLIGVAVGVWRDGRVLLVQRGKQPNYGEWTFPGGLVELGEELSLAARREIREECAVEIAEPRLLTTVDAIVRDEDGRVRYHFVLIEMVAQWLSGEPVAGDDAMALGWFDPADLAGLALTEETEKVIGLALERFAREG